MSKITMLCHEPEELLPMPVEVDANSLAIKAYLDGWFTTIRLGRGYVGYFRTNPDGLKQYQGIEIANTLIFGPLLIAKSNDKSLTVDEIKLWMLTLSGKDKFAEA